MGADRVRRNSLELQEVARGMRKVPTCAEAVLWEALRDRRLNGMRFRRQHPVGRFVLDFYCPIAKLVVELDGGIHDGQQERDAARSTELNAGGYRVIRFRNEEILGDLPAVLRRIEAEAVSRF